MPLSVERYFQSLEHVVDSVTSSCVSFEPVPEPDIDVTPRNDEAVNRFSVEGGFFFRIIIVTAHLEQIWIVLYMATVSMKDIIYKNYSFI